MPSTRQKPDLDWSQIRETVLMLNLCVARIERAMKDGDESVAALADLFTSIVGNVQVVRKAAEQLPETKEKAAIDSNYSAASRKMNDAIVAFQFYDKLVQRLTHVSKSLGFLAELISDPEKLYNPYEWYGLQEKIKSKYTLGSDKAMFDAVLSGVTVEEAMHLSGKETNADEARTGVELF